MNIKGYATNPLMWIYALILLLFLAPAIGTYTTDYGRKCHELGGHLDLDWKCYKITTEILKVE